MTEPVGREVCGYLLVRGSVHAYALALKQMTGVQVEKMLPTANIDLDKIPECQKYLNEGIGFQTDPLRALRKLANQGRRVHMPRRNRYLTHAGARGRGLAAPVLHGGLSRVCHALRHCRPRQNPQHRHHRAHRRG